MQHDSAVGVNQGAFHLFFGGQPGEDGEILLATYLDSLADDCQRLRLHRLTDIRQDGTQQAESTDHLRLQDVYTSLTTDGPPHRRYQGFFPAVRVRHFLERLERIGRTADAVLPERVADPIIGVANEVQVWSDVDMVRRKADGKMGIADLPDATLVRLRLVRPELALEAIRAERRLVLLGEPGAGKSTALRYLALLLAQRLRSRTTHIPGWPDGNTPVPVVVPLGQVAAALRAGAADAYAALLQVFGDTLEAKGCQGLRRFLEPALREGGLLLLCDGLDELPVTDADKGVPPRISVAAALRRLARETRARIVVTSRVLPYHAPGDWKLLPEDGWTLRTVQPLAFGQTRAFVQGWYQVLAVTDPDLANGKASERAAHLVTELEQIERLRPLVRSPLLLTMLAILHYTTGNVPRDRAKLYEECVELLLDHWEPERQPGMSRQSLIERLDLLSPDPLRQVIHELAYTAHLQPPGDDGRGMIGVDVLRVRMFTFFKRLGSLADAETKVRLFLTMLDSEDSRLLQRRGDKGYALPHLTFQEYLAACYIADHPKMMELAYAQWRGADRERWREVLLLMMGRLHQQGKAEEKGLPWLMLLAGAKLGKVPKDAGQHRYDTVLAALSYADLRARGAFAGSRPDIVAELDSSLCGAIRPLLEIPDVAITTADRVAAAQVLADLGESRYPVKIADWRRELGRRSNLFNATGDHYWRYVRPGTYRIGGWKTGDERADRKIALFWIARFPLTVAQYAPFVAEGYRKGAERWWLPESWAWRQKNQRTKPWRWNDSAYAGTNQPVIGVTWHEATAFCAWLTEQLQVTLPDRYVVRLPSEAEWEVAASYDARMQRHVYPWGNSDPTPERAIYDQAKLGRPAPVGCCPAGVAACGALDLVGNVWELTASDYRAYPAGSYDPQKDLAQRQTAWRGGSWAWNSSYVRCDVRDWDYLVSEGDGDGFRVVLAPPLSA
jgi:formylglycine-generating enzyme required for sulfatase activity